MGFHSTADFFKSSLIEKIPDKFTCLNGIDTSKNTFNHDVFFQMEHLGDQLERSLNSTKDARVKFEPDGWQVELLDIVDRYESAIVCAPTSSGKTFISYYAMDKILRENDTDVIVFVAPNKALANQIVAEVYTRFGNKQYMKNSPNLLYAMLMPDYKINDPYKCQILVTVPTAFETLLSTSNEWLRNIRYVIIDEIQTLNDKELGSSLEKIIHFVQCPILALSATISNLSKFFDWMQAIMQLKGIKTHMVTHTERFCDLKRYLFVPENSNAVKK
jgi:superfamily II RNA helicase